MAVRAPPRRRSHTGVASLDAQRDDPAVADGDEHAVAGNRRRRERPVRPVCRVQTTCRLRRGEPSACLRRPERAASHVRRSGPRTSALRPRSPDRPSAVSVQREQRAAVDQIHATVGDDRRARGFTLDVPQFLAPNGGRRRRVGRQPAGGTRAHRRIPEPPPAPTSSGVVQPRRDRKQREPRQVRPGPASDRRRMATGGQLHYNILWSRASHTAIIASNFPARSDALEAGRFVTHQTIIVLDFGSQYTQLIARRLRELSVYSEIWPPDTPAETIRARNPVGIILSGGPKSVSDAGRADVRPGALRARPAGARHLLRHAAHGAHARRRGRPGAAARVRPRHRGGRPAGAPAALFANVPSEIRVWASHGDFVAAAPAGLRGRGDQRERAGRRDGRRRPPAVSRCCSIPKSSTPRAASRSCATSPTRSAAASATGRWRRLSKRRRPGSDAQVGRTAGWCAA